MILTVRTLAGLWKHVDQDGGESVSEHPSGFLEKRKNVCTTLEQVQAWVKILRSMLVTAVLWMSPALQTRYSFYAHIGNGGQIPPFPMCAYLFNTLLMSPTLVLKTTGIDKSAGLEQRRR